MLHGEVLKIWEAEAAPASPPEPGKPPVAGQIVALALTGIAVTAINSIVNVTALQKPGGKRLGAADFLRGASLKAGDCFEPGAKTQQPG
jgi:methionyl-tRNA formyltransferase